MLKKNFYLHLCVLALFAVVTAGSVLLPCTCFASDGARRDFIAGDKCWLNLRHNPVRLKYRSNWIKCIKKYKKVFTQYPESKWAPAGMYRTAQLYFMLYKRSLRYGDKAEAVDLLERIKKRYHSSLYRKRARQMLRLIAGATKRKNSRNKISAKYASKKFVKLKSINRKKTHQSIRHSVAGNYIRHTVNKKVLLEKKSGSEESSSESGNATGAVCRGKAKPVPSFGGNKGVYFKDAIVTGLRFWSNPEYTRVVVNADHARPFTEHLLKRDPGLNKPQRLFVDIARTRLGRNVPKFTTINDDLLIQARAGQHTLHSVRVVVDIKSFDNYKVFSLKDPFRLVIDVWSKPKAKQVVTQKHAETSGKLSRISTDNILSSKITKQLALGVRTIIIDPGHGGKDPGAPGYFKGVNEKNITLKIAKRLVRKMRKQLNCNVLLTRSTDRYLTLEERTAIANTKNADLFISIHCNASRNRRLTGIETYYLNLATDDQAIEVAARENATSRRNISDLESILNDLMKNEKINESSRLAADVQRALCRGMRKKYRGIVNLGVKQAPFYVLIGARMPSILVETSFISNRKECKRLLSSRYEDCLCDSIIKGVEKYIKATNPKQL